MNRAHEITDIISKNDIFLYLPRFVIIIGPTASTKSYYTARQIGRWRTALELI